MSKLEILDFIRREVNVYERIKNEYRRKYGRKSDEYRLAEERYTAIWVLACDLGIKVI